MVSKLPKKQLAELNCDENNTYTANKTKLDSIDVRRGVPQRSLLGSVLFLFFTNKNWLVVGYTVMYADNSVTTVRKNNRKSENKQNYEVKPNKTIPLPWWPYLSWQKTVQNTKNIDVVAWSGLEKYNIIKDLDITTVIKTGIQYISAVQETTIRNLAESGMWAPGHILHCLLCHFETYFRYRLMGRDSH